MSIFSKLNFEDDDDWMVDNKGSEIMKNINDLLDLGKLLFLITRLYLDLYDVEKKFVHSLKDVANNNQE